MDQLIRQATIGDAAELVEIYRPAIEESTSSFELNVPSADEFAKRIEYSLVRHDWIVMESENKILGYAYGTTHRARAAYRFSVETSVYIDKSFHGQGIGKRLYLQLLSNLKALGFHNAFAGITLPNAASVALHESIGFEPIGIFREIGFKNDTWLDVGWWQRKV